ncbi:terminase large subunit domain-containing protein [Jatrophihabitans endophyticus]|uniref:terminase large subunit domain-containing protein n=1 Tax=Jatrophihabitans endophyticus TaxID=1206085 RepID=UPI0009346A89|nr:terminase family protein [Jatrophihabitans endophyticus]
MVESLLDPREFARQLVGEPLWPHQQTVVMSPARTRCMVCGRQAGKSRTLAIIALHTAFTRRGARVLVLSAGEDAAKELLADMLDLASSPLLGGSVDDDNKSTITLSNGSEIRCIPASQRRARGPSVDLLILDEAASISDELWRAIRYTIIARPGSKVVMAGTPYGSQERFFAQTFRLGENRAEGYASFHWPSQVSPLVDDKLLQDWRRTDPEWVYRQEVLAEWVDDQQAYFSAEELEEAVADYDLLDADAAREASPFVDGPGHTRSLAVVAGIDWGLRNDANVVALIGALDDFGLNDEILGVGQRAYFVPWLAGRSGWAWHDFASYVADLVEVYDVRMIASEINGVGDAATSILRRELQERRVSPATPLAEVSIDNRRKQAGFGRIKSLLQQRRLVLPRHPDLLRQLNSLQFEYTESGAVRISVPERLGHDDFAMSLLHAVSCASDFAVASWHNPGRSFWAQVGEFDDWNRAYARFRATARERVDRDDLEVVETAGGLVVPRSALPMQDSAMWWQTPGGFEKGDTW